MEIITKLAESVMSRIEAHNSKGPKPKAHLLADHPDLEELMRNSSEVITVGITKRSALVNIASKVGRISMKGLGMKPDSSTSVIIGAFIVETFCLSGVICVELAKAPKDQYDTYYVIAGEASGYSELLTLLDPASTNFPSLTPYADWTGGVHENGAPFIKGSPKDILARINPVEHYYPLKAVNNLQQGGWKINIPVYNVFKHFCKVGGFPSIFPHHDEDKPRLARSSLSTEAKYIIKCADNIGSQSFFHQYNTDFRGRVYPLSAFFNEQSSERSKGLMMFDEGEALGDEGLYWLMFHTANVWGEDKVSLDDRVKFVEDNFELWDLWAKYPLEYTGWMEADKPWSFLSAIIELSNIQESQGRVEDYICKLPIFIDGSNNGVQHMTALTLDEETAPHVNLVPQESAGDVYMHICDAVYTEIENQYDPSLDADFEVFFEKYKELNKGLAELRGEAFAAKLLILNEFRAESDPKRFAPNFFMTITDPKVRRKLVKRPVMVLGYGGTRRGFAKMLVEDTKTINTDFSNMLYTWASFFGDLIFDMARGSKEHTAKLKGLAEVLNLFEGLATDVVKRGEKFSWITPITNFPVVQQYSKARSDIVSLSFMGERLRLKVSVFEEQKVNKQKQKTSAAPNLIHSFDAGHLTITVVEMPFRMATIHDSFGCLPNNMPELFKGVRETFADFYGVDPLANLLDQLGVPEMMPERGTLDLEDIIQSDFAFA